VTQGRRNTDLVNGLRSEVAELESQAVQLENELAEAQARLAGLLTKARAVEAEADAVEVPAMVPKARREAAAIIADARRRAAELGMTAAPVEFQDLGHLLVNHFQLQEQLVQLLTRMALEQLGFDTDQ